MNPFLNGEIETVKLENKYELCEDLLIECDSVLHSIKYSYVNGSFTD